MPASLEIQGGPANLYCNPERRSLSRVVACGPMGTVFRCTDCGNLHGARVDASGMCGSQAIVSVPDTVPPGPGLEGLAGVTDERGADLVDAAIEFFRSFSAWVRAQGVDVPHPPTTPRT